jgi:hypothetical protein
VMCYCTVCVRVCVSMCLHLSSFVLGASFPIAPQMIAIGITKKKQENF